MQQRSTPVEVARMEEMTEAELEGLILAKDSNNDARYILGKLMIEGSSEKVPRNENKGLNWIKEAAKRGSSEAVEYKTYWDIRFDRAPNLQKITENLNKIIDANKSPRACNTLAEINHAQGSSAAANKSAEVRAQGEQKAALAARYYMISAEQGDVVGMHWIGVFYHEGFGVSKDIAKAAEFLSKAADMGNCQSMYQLHMLKSGNEGQDDDFRNVEESYQWLLKGIQSGATFFEDAIKYFKLHYDVLAPVFLKQKQLGFDATDGSKKADILNLHDAGISEMKNDFSTSLGKDRLYHKPCGFLND